MKKWIGCMLALLSTSTMVMAQITERERPASWSQLVKGGRFADRFQPMPDGKLSADTWGAKEVVPRFIDNGIEDRIRSYWGGNILKGEDGKYHLRLWLAGKFSQRTSRMASFHCLSYSF